MPDSKTLALFVAGALCAAAAPLATAQRWNGRSPRDGACFYRDTEFDGRYFCVDAGDELSSLSFGTSDRISSIRVFGRAEVKVYSGSRFRGPSATFHRDVRNLRREGWSDEISSLRVTEGWRRDDGDRDRDRDRDRDERPSGFRGDPDRIVRRAYQDILEREPDAAGLRLYRSRLIDDGWSEEDVREALRKSPEYREKNTMTLAKAQDIVRRAYLAVLKREPDPGSRTYVDKVMRQKWTLEDVEQDLRRSDEYRNRR